MRVATTCELRRDGRLLLRGLAEIRTSCRSWEVTLFAAAGYALDRLTARTYELCLAGGVVCTVSLLSVAEATRQLQLAGLGKPPVTIEI